MKRIISLLSIFIFVVMLCSCGLIAEPIKNPKNDEFEEYYVGDDFTVFIRSEIDPDTLYSRVAFGFGFKGDTCSVGSYEVENYMFHYKDKYYDIVEFNIFRIVSCDDLTDIGIKGEWD